MNSTYIATARLLTEIAPTVFESGIFALKGGTAINLFIRDMPRLSVDLDLVFTDHRVPRTEALAAINEALRAGRERLAKRGFKVQAVSAADMGETKLLVQRDDLSVKIEVNTVIRGTVHGFRYAARRAFCGETFGRTVPRSWQPQTRSARPGFALKSVAVRRGTGERKHRHVGTVARQSAWASNRRIEDGGIAVVGAPSFASDLHASPVGWSQDLVTPSGERCKSFENHYFGRLSPACLGRTRCSGSSPRLTPRLPSSACTVRSKPPTTGCGASARQSSRAGSTRRRRCRPRAGRVSPARRAAAPPARARGVRAAVPHRRPQLYARAQGPPRPVPFRGLFRSGGRRVRGSAAAPAPDDSASQDPVGRWPAVCSFGPLVMPDRFPEDLLRELIDQIDARLREAERVRNTADEQYRDRPFWPERRRHTRTHDSDQPKSRRTR